MEIFRTIVPVFPSPIKINYSTKLMLQGSCFSEYIGNKLIESKFLVNNNPFGIVFNPLSIAIQLERLMNPIEYTQDDLFFNEDIWCSFDHHSRFSSYDEAYCLSNINQQLLMSHDFLRKTDLLFLTFGTSYVFYLRGTDRVVSNCHKIPSKEFDRKRAAHQHISSVFSELIPKLQTFNPNLHVVFTVSPIRHWKDGAHDNQLSKANLLLAIDEITNTFQNTSYCPSYELIMDDLRDYRFYAEDMLHPNSLAINYIWERFKECYMKPDTLSLMKEVEKIIQAANHRPFNPKTEAFQSFARQFYDKIQHLKGQYNISFEEEEKYFKSYLTNIS